PGDALPARHAAGIAFDSAVLVLLLFIGRRMRPGRDGLDLGVILCFAWAAYPYTDYVLQSNSNDSLVAVFVLLAVLWIASPARRGAATALAGLTKFVPFLLAPLFAAGPRAGLLAYDPDTGDAPLSRPRLKQLGWFVVGL